MLSPARTRWSGARRGRGGARWRFAASLALLLPVALGAGLLTAGLTLPPPQPPRPPAAPIGGLGDIPGFRPDPADRTGLADPAGPADRAGLSPEIGRAGDATPFGAARSAEDPAGGADEPATGREAGLVPRGLTATRAPAAPPPIPPAEPAPRAAAPPGEPAGELPGESPGEPAGAAPAGDPVAAPAGAAADVAPVGSDAPAPRPGGPPVPRAGDPDAPAPPPGPPPATPLPLPALGRSEPRRIGIPSIRVDAEVIEVGADSRGELEVPPLETPMLAGWYRLGPSPGEPGNSVIVGHVDSRKKGPAVFFDLGLLRKGDLITVTRADGTVVRFAVDDVRLFPKSDFPSEAVYGTGDQPRLRVVTCGGRYDPAVRDYLDNVIVFASRVP